MHTEPLAALGSTDLELEVATLLPPRETLCAFGCTNVVNVVGVNVSIAVNAASINAEANALATQYLSAVQYR
ncbi:MAG: hypothetical protein ACXWDI_06265 [Nocardioides sp.]